MCCVAVAVTVVVVCVCSKAYEGCSIDLATLRRLCVEALHMQPCPSQLELEELFWQLDSDHDGLVSFEDFLLFMARSPSPPLSISDG